MLLDRKLRVYSIDSLQLLDFFVQFYGVSIMRRTGNNFLRTRVAKLLWPV
jgi:hypothetical protein